MVCVYKIQDHQEVSQQGTKAQYTTPCLLPTYLSQVMMVLYSAKSTQPAVIVSTCWNTAPDPTTLKGPLLQSIHSPYLWCRRLCVRCKCEFGQTDKQCHEMIAACNCNADDPTRLKRDPSQIYTLFSASIIGLSLGVIISLLIN